MNMKKRLLSALTLVALVLQLLGCLPAAAATTTTAAETPKIPKFLIVGNSFAVDAMKSYFRAILKAEGVTEYTIGYLYYAGCTVAEHASFAKDDEAVYEFYKSTASSGWPEDAADDTTMLTALRDEEWDYVFLQQASKKAADPDTYNEDIDYLMEYVRQNVPNPGVKFGWHMTWAFSKDLQEATSSMSATTRPVIFESFGRDSQKMYQAIADAVQSNILSRPFSIVIPSGTAIENVRASHIGDTMQTNDGYHLDSKGDLIASYCWYAALTGKTIDSLKYVPSDLGLSEVDKAVIVEAVNNAVKNPYSITPPTVDDSTVLYSLTADEISATGTFDRYSKVFEYWGINTQDVDWTSGNTRDDINFIPWANIRDLNETNASGRLVRIYTAAAMTGGKLTYGLPEGTPLSLTLTADAEGKGFSWSTNEYGEIVLTFQYARTDLNMPSIDLVGDGFQVRVSTDKGEHWSADYAGIKSHRIIAEGNLKADGSGSAVKCYEVTSEDLTDLVAEGGTINAIQILPFGSFDDFNADGSKFVYVRSIGITGYESEASAKVNETVDGDILRQIVAAHAKRLNGDTWVSEKTINSNGGYTENEETGETETVGGINYHAGITYSGPIYSGNNASTYERFLSDIDENGNYTGALRDSDYGDTGINGMDCITVVYDCLSQVTTSRSASNWYYMFHDLYDEEDNPNGKVVPLYTAAGRGNIDRDTTDTYFSTLVSTEEGKADMYALYDALRPGDFITNSGHTRVITSNTADGNVYVGETAGGTIQHHYRLTNGEEESFVKPTWNADPEIYVRDNPDTVSEHLYSTSMRYNREISTETIYNTLYLPYTLREYTTGQVEKENVLITTNSVDHPTDFITNGFCAAIDSNYTIRTLTVTLTDKSKNETLYSKSVYGVQSDYSYLFSGETLDDNQTSLNTALADLKGKIGQYELKVEVLSGPRIYLEDGSVIKSVADASNTVNPTTTFTYNLSSQHAVTVGEVENGTVMLNKTNAQYGDTVIVTAVPDLGYELEAICVDGTAITGNTFTVSGAHEVTAKFKQVIYTVTPAIPKYGTVTVDKYEGAEGVTVTVTATPDAGYVLGAILVDDVEIEGTTFTITGNHTVSARFDPDLNATFTVKTVQPDHGSVKVNGKNETSGKYDASVTVTATPDDGYKLWAILVDCAAIQGNTFTIHGNHTVTALFVPEGIGGGEDETLPVAIPGPQKEEPEPVITCKSVSMSLEDVIYLNLYTTLNGFDPTLDLTKAAGLLVWTEDPGTAEQAQSKLDSAVKITGAQVDEQGRYRLTTDGIPAAEWGDTVYMLAFVDCGANTVYADMVVSTSPKDEAYYLIAYEPDYKDVSIALLNYGAAAQTYFNHNADQLMNADLDDDQKTLGWDTGWLVDVQPAEESKTADFASDAVVSFASDSLTLEGAINLNFYVTVAESVAVAESGLLFWTQEQYDSLEKLTVETAVQAPLTVKTDGRYFGSYLGIPAAEIDRTLYACAYVVDEDGNTHYSGVLADSPMAYAKWEIDNSQDAELVSCMQWLVKYGHVANETFNGEEAR